MEVNNINFLFIRLTMSEIDLATACVIFDNEVTLQYQNRSKLQGTIEECHGLHGTALNVIAWFSGCMFNGLY